MRTAKEILEDLKYWVYSPEEEASEPNVGRSKFDSKEIRNIMMSYFLQGDPLDTIREYIDKMPDEWVCEFLRHQGDTVVEPVVESLNEGYELPEDEWYYTHNTDSMYYDISYNVPAKETAKIDAGKGEDGNPEFWFNGNHEKFAGLPYKEQAKLPQTGPYKTVKECMDAYLLWFKAIKKNEGIKLNGMKISKPYYEG